jgi:orotidine-5'-phosphate decarboxylase
LKKVIDHAHGAGLLVVADGKRNDVGHTAAAYAQGWLGRNSPWGADALTTNPYLGEDSLQPLVQAASEVGAGLFVLVKTSNPGGGQFQDLHADGRPIYRHVAQMVERLAEATAGPSGYGLVGAVAGATWPAQLAELRAAMPHAWLLVPGYGGQGGSPADVAAAFDQQGLGALINNARGLIYAFRREPYSNRFGAGRWQQAIDAATRDMIAALRVETAAGRL